MRILVADKFPVFATDALRASGHEVTYQPELTEGALVAAVDGHDALVVRSTRVTAATVEARSLNLVVRAGSGTNTIDLSAAAINGVTVCNTPGKNSVAVAELAMGLLLAVDRNIPDNVADLRQGVWNKREYAKARGLKGRKLGIVGFGTIGSEMAVRAAAFGLQIFTVGRPGRSERALQLMTELGVTTVANLEELFSTVDIISLHVPTVPATVGIIGRELLPYIKPGTVIINTSRGEAIDEAALLEVIEEQDLRLGTDVYRNEPAEGDSQFASALAHHPRVYGTHHIGASTDQAQHAVAEEVVAVIAAFTAGMVRNQVLA